MKVSDITIEDGRACAYLLNFIKIGRWELSGEQAEQLLAAKRWVASLAQDMAKELKAPTPPAGGGMKIKAAGPLAQKQQSKRKK